MPLNPAITGHVIHSISRRMRDKMQLKETNHRNAAVLLALFTLVWPMIASAADGKLHPYYHFPPYHDSSAIAVPSFTSVVCLRGTVEKGHFTVSNSGRQSYFYLHLLKPVNLMPPISRDPAFYYPKFHTYDIGLLVTSQLSPHALYIKHRIGRMVSLKGSLEIPMFAIPGQARPPLTVFLDVTKVSKNPDCIQ